MTMHRFEARLVPGATAQQHVDLKLRWMDESTFPEIPINKSGNLTARLGVGATIRGFLGDTSGETSAIDASRAREIIESEGVTEGRVVPEEGDAYTIPTADVGIDNADNFIADPSTETSGGKDRKVAVAVGGNFSMARLWGDSRKLRSGVTLHLDPIAVILGSQSASSAHSEWKNPNVDSFCAGPGRLDPRCADRITAPNVQFDTSSGGQGLTVGMASFVGLDLDLIGYKGSWWEAGLALRPVDLSVGWGPLGKGETDISFLPEAFGIPGLGGLGVRFAINLETADAAEVGPVGEEE